MFLLPPPPAQPVKDDAVDSKRNESDELEFGRNKIDEISSAAPTDEELKEFEGIFQNFYIQ